MEIKIWGFVPSSADWQSTLNPRERIKASIIEKKGPLNHTLLFFPDGYKHIAFPSIIVGNTGIILLHTFSELHKPRQWVLHYLPEGVDKRPHSCEKRKQYALTFLSGMAAVMDWWDNSLYTSEWPYQRMHHLIGTTNVPFAQFLYSHFPGSTSARRGDPFFLEDDTQVGVRFDLAALSVNQDQRGMLLHARQTCVDEQYHPHPPYFPHFK